MPENRNAFRSHPDLYMASSLPDAIAALAQRGERGQALAGGTWIMRAPVRGEAQDRDYVGLSRIDTLRELRRSDTALAIGACVTHAQLARELPADPAWEALALAAAKSANPAVRNTATLGGNLCAASFAAADLVPALMCLDATVEVEGTGGAERIGVEAFVERREAFVPGTLVTGVTIDRDAARRRISTHARLPLRRAGDYPVAIVSMSAQIGDDGKVLDARIAVGSVEAVPRRWTAMEETMAGRPLDDAGLAAKARLASAAFTGRDGVEAPGWYRVRVLPVLFERAIAQLRQGAGR